MAPGAPDRDGHIAPKVALVEVMRRQRADLEETAYPLANSTTPAT